VLVKLLANLKVKEIGQEVLLFTGGDESTAAAETEAAALVELGSGTCIGELGLQKGRAGAWARV
jgi:hypothetical protein